MVRRAPPCFSLSRCAGTVPAGALRVGFSSFLRGFLPLVNVAVPTGCDLLVTYVETCAADRFDETTSSDAWVRLVKICNLVCAS